MNFSNLSYEIADLRAEQERQAGVDRIRRSLSATSGRVVCDCGDEISEARRRAAPFSGKCIECARRGEMKRRA